MGIFQKWLIFCTFAAAVNGADLGKIRGLDYGSPNTNKDPFEVYMLGVAGMDIFTGSIGSANLSYLRKEAINEALSSRFGTSAEGRYLAKTLKEYGYGLEYLRVAYSVARASNHMLDARDWAESPNRYDGCRFDSNRVGHLASVLLVSDSAYKRSRLILSTLGFPAELQKKIFSVSPAYSLAKGGLDKVVPINVESMYAEQAESGIRFLHIYTGFKALDIYAPRDL